VALQPVSDRSSGAPFALRGRIGTITPPLSELPIDTAASVQAAAPRTEATAGFAFTVFCVYTFILMARPQDFVPALMPLRLALTFTVITAVVTLLGNVRAAQPLLGGRETRLFLMFFAGMLASIPLSIYRRGSFETVVLQYVANVAFYFLFVLHVNTVRKYRRVVLVLVAAVLTFTIVGLTQGHFVNGRYVTGSPMYDPNDSAFLEVSLLLFPLAGVVGSYGWLMKLAGIAAIGLAGLLTLLTGSRGGLIGLGIFLLLLLMLRVGNVGKGMKVALCLTVLILASLNLDKINTDRYETIGAIENDYNFQEFGRVDIWRRGLQLFAGQPITGVGVNGFGAAIGYMRAEEDLVPKWQAAHNAYLQVLTETGLLGFVPFALLITVTGRHFNRLRKRAAADSELGALPGLLFIGYIAMLVSASFLSQSYSVLFVLYFATSAALRTIAAEPAAVPATVR